MRVCRQSETAPWFASYHPCRPPHLSIASISSEANAASLPGCHRTSHRLLTAATGACIPRRPDCPRTYGLNLNCIFRSRLFGNFHESKFNTSHSCTSKSEGLAYVSHHTPRFLAAGTRVAFTALAARRAAIEGGICGSTAG